MSEADKMFEELGYEKKECAGMFIEYSSTKDYVEIWFDTKKKEICCQNDEDESVFLPMQELKAINKKCEELGWI